MQHHRRICRIPFQSKYEWLETTHPALAIKLINSIARYRGYSPFGQLVQRGSAAAASRSLRRCGCFKKTQLLERRKAAMKLRESTETAKRCDSRAELHRAPSLPRIAQHGCAVFDSIDLCSRRGGMVMLDPPNLYASLATQYV